MDGKARQQREEKNEKKREGGEEVDTEPAETLAGVKLSVDRTFPEIYFCLPNISISSLVRLDQ